MSEAWNAPMMCPDCGYKLQSKRPGQFVMCKCPTSCFVDQDNIKLGDGWYGRYGGHKIPVKWDEEESIRLIQGAPKDLFQPLI